jgi:hypothetical protein
MLLELLLLAALMVPVLPADSDPSNAEALALAYLSREVPRWSQENHCYSCHNNGDAARALYAGQRAGHTIPPSALAATTAWLTHPHRWDHNGGKGPFSDKRLARVQFTTALVAASEAGFVPDPRALIEAAALLVPDQAPDGSWPLEGDDTGGPGSPATYGRPLATHLARECLRAADPILFREPIARAGRWLAEREIRTVIDASVALLALGSDPSKKPFPARNSCLALLRKGQAEDGGWGPFAASPPEVFDTALAVLGLSRIKLDPDDRPLIARGRAFLIGRQRPDGSWIETTRPPGAESYAQRISTTGWAALALLATSDVSTTRGADPKR